jgi:hypothetical protein
MKNDQKLKIFDTLENNTNIFIDNNITSGEKYKYFVVPYYLEPSSKKRYYGKEIELETIKTPSNTLGEKWWNDDL